MTIPTGKHNDWPWPFSYIPRSWTAWTAKQGPKKLLGNTTPLEHLDVPDPGHWALAWPLHFAIHFKNGWLFRIGIRYDYVDQYYTFPAFTIKRT